MISNVGKTKRKSKQTISAESRKQRLERELEQALKNTFPASDAVAVTEPAPTAPGDGSEKTSTRVRRERS